MAEIALPRRPIAVVLLQAFILLSVGLMAAPLLPAFVDAVPDAVRQRSLKLGALLLGMLAVGLFGLFTFWALWRREPYARWLGLGWLGLVALGIAGGFFDERRAAAGLQGGFPWGKALAFFVLAGWGYVVGFSRGARAFFAGTIDAGSAPNPPVAALLLEAWLTLALPFVAALFAYASFGTTVAEVRQDPFGWSAQTLAGIALLALLACTLWGLRYRKPYGRSLGLATIALMAAGLVAAISFGRHPLRADDVRPWATLAALGVLAWWFYALGFTRESKAFFAPGKEQA